MSCRRSFSTQSRDAATPRSVKTNLGGEPSDHSLKSRTPISHKLHSSLCESPRQYSSGFVAAPVVIVISIGDLKLLLSSIMSTAWLRESVFVQELTMIATT